MKKFNNVNQAFIWTFNEKEDFVKIKKYFNLSDEVENITDIQIEVSQDDMEKYLLTNSFVTKKDNNYIFKR